MAGVRRRLRDVGSRVSGVLEALRDEVVPEALGGRPAASDEAPDESPDQSPDEAPDAGPPAGAEAADAAARPGEPVVDDTGDVPQLADAPADSPADPLAGTAPGTTAVLDAPADPSGDDVPAPPPLDEVCAAAVEVARAAAVEEAGDSPSRGVGEHLGVEAEDPTVVTHSFATTDPAYVGWRWAVTLARAEGTDDVTVDEVVLLPGAGALLAPAWVPYSERVQPDDLSPGDLLPPAADDPRLVPAHAGPGDVLDELVEDVFWELGLGRPRVLSLEGRADAAERWYDGDAGPASPRAKAAPGRCGDCGFLVPLGGALRAAFGACANAQAPDDGRVVALTHGCGAHSETPVELTHVATSGMAVDEAEFDIEAHDEAEGAAEGAAGTADPAPPPQDAPPPPAPDPLPEPAEEEQAEQLGHS